MTGPDKTRPHPFILVSGGCRSGKSAYAQGLAERLGQRRLYLATASAADGEMRRRVEEHQKARGDGWRLHEMDVLRPFELWHALPDIARAGEPLLLDCLTLWAAACMQGDAGPPDFSSHCDRLARGLWDLPCPVIVVANEVGMGVVPPSAAGRAFRDMSGLAAQTIARLAFPVILMVSGIPLAVKGSLP